MSPRTYQPGARRIAATQATRSKIIAAARDILTDPSTVTFSIDAVAQRADVARMTVYYQFKSKRALVEALFDDFGARANMREMRKVFEEPQPLESVNILVGVFCRLWETQGALLRKLTALATLDAEVDSALMERAKWRRDALATILQRIDNLTDYDDLLDTLHAITSLETYGFLARSSRQSSDVTRIIQRSARVLIESSMTHEPRAAKRTSKRGEKMPCPKNR